MKKLVLPYLMTPTGVEPLRKKPGKKSAFQVGSLPVPLAEFAELFDLFCSLDTPARRHLLEHAATQSSQSRDKSLEQTLSRPPP